MTAENTIQWMMDFYSDIFPTRKHCLNHLFCTIGNGCSWENGELINWDTFRKRYKMIKNVKKAHSEYEELWYNAHDLEMKRAAEIQNYRVNRKYIFNWYPLSKEYSKLYNYPENITPDWLAVLNECKQLLIEDGYIDENGEFLISKVEMISRKMNG